ncbi:hypothetical protein BHE74_00018727, partial [Ensete ventricosum]
LVDCLNWRKQNHIDDILAVNYYVQSHIQMNEYRDRVILPAATKKYGRHVGTCVKVLDMSGLKLSALSQIKVPLHIFSLYFRNFGISIMDYASLPHFCKREGSGSSRHSSSGSDDCFSFDHPFHQQLYSYIKQQALGRECIAPLKQGSFHVDVPDPNPEGIKIAKTIESEMHKLEDRNGLGRSLSGLNI